MAKGVKKVGSLSQVFSYSEHFELRRIFEFSLVFECTCLTPVFEFTSFHEIHNDGSFEVASERPAGNCL